MQQPIDKLKKVLRKEMTTLLKTIPTNSIQIQSNLITNKILNSDWFKTSNKISIYCSTKIGEIQTDEIIKIALEQGKHLYIPFCPIESPTVMKMLRLKDLNHYESLQLNRWGIRDLNPETAHLLEDADSFGLDLILVPGLAFSLDGNRLGHGRGYYDRYISQCEATYPQRFGKPAPFTAALALREQILPAGQSVPTNEFDKKPQVIVTPDWSLESKN